MRRSKLLLVVALLGLLAAACPGGETLSQDTEGDEAETAETPAQDPQPDTAGEPPPALPQVEAAEATGTFTPISGDCSGFSDTFTYAIDGTTGTVTITQPATDQSVSGPIDRETLLAEATGRFEQYRLLIPLSDTVVVAAYVHLFEGGCEGEMHVRFDFETGLCAQGDIPEDDCPFSAEPPADPECPFEAPTSCEEWDTFYDEQVCDAVGRCG